MRFISGPAPKPHLTKWAPAPIWRCSGAGHLGSGRTPEDAYAVWRFSLMLLPGSTLPIAHVPLRLRRNARPLGFDCH